MGNCWGHVFRRRRIRRHIVLILIGLDNAGKTQTVNNLVGEKDEKILPTVGFKAINLVHKNTPVTVYDLGGGPQFRQIWSQYYSEVHGVIFVIDSSDFSRLEECREVLEEVLSHDKISGKPILVLANKQDKQGALDDIDVVEKLNIEPLVNKYRCPTLVESYTAENLDTKTKKSKIDPDLKRGYHWLLNYIIRRYGDINLRVQTDIHADLERRKRMLNKASNRASQTFIAVSGDIATQTGFENPNFHLNKTEIKNENDLEASVIIVKPIAQKNNSIGDTTVTVESIDDSDNTSGQARPKLSPFFGRANNTSSSEATRIELEHRTEFRKLSPIVRNKSSVHQHIDFMNRPQSSPSIKRKIKDEPLSTNSSIQEDDQKTVVREYYGDGNHAWDRNIDTKHRVFSNDMELAQVHREIAFTEREYWSKQASSDVAMGTSMTMPASLSPRPASASQLIRRQLELSSQHKRRLSLRYNMQRNKTSPERISMMFLEPSKVPKRLDKGDFERKAVTN